MSAIIVQVNALLTLLDQAASSTSTPLSAARQDRVQEDVIRSIQSQGLFTALADSAFSASGANVETSNSLIKIVKRINHLLPAPIGVSLALEIARQVGWPIISYGTNATTWLNACFSVLQSYVSAESSSSLGDEEQLHDAIELASDYILSHGNQDNVGSEYMRTVVTPNLPNLAKLLTSSLESSVARSDSRPIITFMRSISQRLRRHPNLYRPMAEKIHAACIQTMFPSSVDSLPPLALARASARLCIDLHRTGAMASKGKAVVDADTANTFATNTRATQAQLWNATMETAFATFQLFAEACTGTIVTSAAAAAVRRRVSGSAAIAKHRPVFPIPEESKPNEGIDGTLEHIRNLGWLKYLALVLLELLGQASAPSATVSLPLSSFILWCVNGTSESGGSRRKGRAGVLNMTRSASLAREDAEKSLFVVQMTTLEQVQKSVLLLLSRLLIAAGSRAAALDAIRPLDVTGQTSGSLLSSLVQLYEAEAAAEQAGSDLGSTLLRVISLLVCSRAHAVQSSTTIHGLAVPLEPTSQLVRRLARISSSQLARFLLGTNARDRILRTSRASLQETASTGASSRSAKRMKANNGAASSFETDTIFSGLSGSAAALALSVPRGVATEEAARTLASMDLLATVFPHLTCQLTSEMTDLATTTGALAVAMVEALFASGVNLAPQGMEASLATAALWLLDTVLHHANGTTLAMVSTRARPLLQQAARFGPGGSAIELAAEACERTLHNLAQPKMISVPEWNREVLDLETTEAALLRGAEGTDEDGKHGEDGIRVDPIDAMQVDFVHKAARDVLGVDMDPRRANRTAAATEAVANAQIDQMDFDSARHEEDDAITSAGVEAQVTFPSKAAAPILAAPAADITAASAPQNATDMDEAQAETGPSHSATAASALDEDLTVPQQPAAAAAQALDQDSDDESLPALDLTRTDDEDEEE